MAESKPVSLLAPPLHELDALQVDGDAGRLQQVLWNLLANAVKFTPAGGEVRLTVHADPTTVHVAVSDTGSGIDAALLPHIFDPFTKQQRANTQGLGLGLAIAREIVEKHGGSIQARSDGAGTGSTFTVRLPRHAAI